MEVHHHSGEHHGPKKFKEYFKEFLMIFLAVTMGFIAENVREYLTDKNHVSELADQLKEDLINDTIKVQYHIEFIENQIRRADSLHDLLQQPFALINYKQLQNMIIDCDRIDFFYPSTGAISTIKRELQLKKFVKTKISMHIDNYEKDIAVLEKYELRDIEYLGKYLESFVSGHFTPENASFAIRRLPVANGNMRNLKADDLVQLNVDVHLIKSYNLRLLAQYLKIRDDATAFIIHINKTYELDE
jgi:hypothetical protein